MPDRTGYDYGPPVTVGVGWGGQDDKGTPQDNSDAEVVVIDGDMPMDPPPDAETIVEPGGSPTDESAVIPQDEVKITTTAKDLKLTLNYTGPGIENGCQIFWGDEDEFTDDKATYVGPGALAGPPVDHTYAKAGTYSVSVDPYGDMYPMATKDVTVTAPAAQTTTTTGTTSTPKTPSPPTDPGDTN